MAQTPKLTPEQVAMARRRMRTEFISYGQLARELDVSRSTVWDAINGYTHKDVREKTP